MEASSLLYFLIYQCHQSLLQRQWEDGLWVACVYGCEDWNGNSLQQSSQVYPKCLSHPLLSLSISPFFSSPNLLPYKVQELRCSGILPLLSSGIRVGHLERGWWERKKCPDVNPWGHSTGGLTILATGKSASLGCIPETWASRTRRRQLSQAKLMKIFLPLITARHTCSSLSLALIVSGTQEFKVHTEGAVGEEGSWASKRQCLVLRELVCDWGAFLFPPT